MVRWLGGNSTSVGRALDAAAALLIAAAFLGSLDGDLLLDGLWLVLAVGAFVFTLPGILVRIGLVVAAEVGYLGFTGGGNPIEEILEPTGVPLVLAVSTIVALLADRLATIARGNATLYREASEGLVKAQQEERARLARDLHDGVGQALTAALLSLEVAGPQVGPELSVSSTPIGPDERTAFERARALVQTALDEVRGVAEQLVPRSIHEAGLGEAITSLARSAGTPVEVRFPSTLLPAGLLGRPRAVHVYRIVQEAVANATRHADAPHIWIDASLVAGVLTLEVGDDGVGFDAGREVLGFGLGIGVADMEERASLIGGSLVIRSRRGHGTVVCLVVATSEAAQHSDAQFDEAELSQVGPVMT